ncbi:MAG: methionine--tRNA ligase [Acidimicrobiia bacterium]
MARTFTITTPIYYVNDVPHIGHAYTTVAADVIARWRRLWGDEVFFLTGTDEHGLKMAQAARRQGVEPKAWADLTSERFREEWAALDITNDDFIRTTEPRHYEAVGQFLQRVYDAGDIELGTYEGLYCVACEAYYVEDDLVNGVDCPIHARPVERMREENYFFKLSRYQERLERHYAEHPEAVGPSARRNEVLGLLRQGLSDFSISRTSISWGVPIPWDPSHVAYVWFDALINYCTAVGYGQDRARFERFWPADCHLVGKDILRFHAVYWPAMLMSAGEAPPRQVFAHGWLLVGGEKMSKTRLNQIAPADLLSEFGPDGLRYHLVRDQPFGPDGDFSYEAMLSRYNTDLANNFGNLANRVLTMAVNYLGGTVPEEREDGPLRDQASGLATTMDEAMRRLDFATALGAVWDLIRAANSYIEDRQPWALNKEGGAAAVAPVLGDCLEALRLVALLAAPVMPRASGELWRRLGLTGTPEWQRLPEAAVWGGLPPGATLERGAPLFPRLEA